ncbi:MAG: hypothetical protein AAFU03_10435, partial [Bacteroidota bacterium]
MKFAIIFFVSVTLYYVLIGYDLSFNSVKILGSSSKAKIVEISVEDRVIRSYPNGRAQINF